MPVGVVIAARDAGAWIADAVGSVRAQTHREWQLAVVDDGSRDATAERAVEAAGGDARVMLVRQVGAGVSAARNRGASALAGCGTLLFLDADDWLAPHALRRLVECLRAAPEAGAACGGCALVAADAVPGAWPMRLLHPPSGDLLEPLLGCNRFANCGQVLIRAGAFARAGPFRPELAYGEDWEFLVRLAAGARFASLAASEMPTLFVRRRPGGAFLGQAAVEGAAEACMEAIFAAPEVVARVPASRLRALRRRAETEALWTAGRALIAQGRCAQGRAALRRALLRHPSVRRALIMLANASIHDFVPLR